MKTISELKERILSLLDNKFDAMDINQIYDALNLDGVEDFRDLENAIIELNNELEVYTTKKNKYILYKNCSDFRIGVIDVSKKGFGFLLNEDKSEGDIHIEKNQLNYALDGDTVLVQITGESKGKKEGKVLKIVKRDINNFVGKLIRVDGKLTFVPNEPLKIDLTVDPASYENMIEGSVVVASVDTDLGKNRYLASVKHCLGHMDDPGIDIKEVAAKYEIYEEFPKEALDFANALPKEVEEKDFEGRRDLRDEIIFTIDGADTKDIDDAISLTKEVDENGILKFYTLKVSIADVSYYVEEDSALDEEAYRRGTSCYPADKVFPMLPHVVSNGICSLNEDVDRCAMTCEMKINNQGRVIDYDIYPSIIHSKKKMTYSNVNKIIEEDTIPEGYEPFADILKEMNELHKIIRAERVRRGASEFETDEIKIKCDETGKAIDVEKRERGEGEKLIEDFMIVANETVATAISNLELPFVYRIHEDPIEDKVTTFINFCSLTGHPIKGKFKEMSPKQFQNLINQVNEFGSVFADLAKRVMAKAKYDPENVGHFGLASRCYTHFTSPIRRYPDLTVHRLLRAYLFENRIDRKTVDYYSATLTEVCNQCSKREVAADQAEREVDKMKMAEYMESHIGEEYEATISGVNAFGFFVQLPNLVEGLVKVDSLDSDYYEFREELYALVGQRSKKMYQIGDKLLVKCVGANKIEETIDFEAVKEKKLDKEEVQEEGKKLVRDGRTK
jgi:ribonuclease R